MRKKNNRDSPMNMIKSTRADNEYILLIAEDQTADIFINKTYLKTKLKTTL